MGHPSILCPANRHSLRREASWPSSAFRWVLPVLDIITLLAMAMGQISVGEGNVGWADTLKGSRRKSPGRTLRKEFQASLPRGFVQSIGME